MFDFKQTHIAHEWKHASPLIACRFDPQGRFLFTSSEDMGVQRWSFASGEKEADYLGHDSWVRDIAFLPDGQTMITVASDDKMIFWSTTAEKPEPLKSIEAHRGWIRTVSVSPDGKWIATGGNDNLVKLWNADGSLVRELAGHDSHVYSTLFTPDGKSLLSGDLSCVVRQWDLATGAEQRTFDAGELHTYNKGQQVHYGGVRSMAFSPDGKHLLCGGLHNASNPLGAINEPIVLFFEWESQKKVRSHVAEGVRGVAWRVVFLSNEMFLAAAGGSGGGFLLFWQTGQEKEVHQVKLPNTARGLDLHPDGLHLATIHHDRTVRISRMTAKATA